MAQDINILHQQIPGKYIMADIGADNFMNYGFREGFGLVFIDYPYLYKTDES